MIEELYLKKRKIKNIYFEVISNIKILYIKFLMKLSTIKILPNSQGLDKGGNTGQRRIWYSNKPCLLIYHKLKLRK